MIEKKWLMFFACWIQAIVSVAEFSVYTQNILGPNTMDVADLGFQKASYDRINKIIESATKTNATFLCFQEWDAETFKNLDSAIKEALKKEYEFVSWGQKGVNGGVALYKKRDFLLKTVEKKSIELPSDNPKFSGACAYGIFEMSGHPVLIASFHISRSNEAKYGKNSGDLQWKAFADAIKNYSGSVVLVGDFNTFYNEVATLTINTMSQELQMPIKMYEHNSWTVSDKDGKFAAIDHVLYSDSLQLDVAKSWIGRFDNPYLDQQQVTGATSKIPLSLPKIQTAGYGSDHLPIFATLKFSDPAAPVKIPVKPTINSTGKPTTPAPHDPQAATAPFNIDQWFKDHEEKINMCALDAIGWASGYPATTDSALLAGFLNINVSEVSDEMVHRVNRLIKEIESKSKMQTVLSRDLLIQALELASCLK